MRLARNSVFRLAVVSCVLVASAPAAPAAPEQDAAVQAGVTVSSEGDRACLVQHLVDRGATQEQAAGIVGSLTDEDVRVLADNPKMLSSATANSTLITWAIFLAIIATGVTLVVLASN